MQSVAVGWQVYEITRRPLDLGLIGLAQFLPGILLFLVSGHVADRFDRRKVVTWCYCGFAVASGLLWAIAWRGKPFGTSDLRRRGAGRRGARLQRSGEPGASATTGAGGTFPQRSGLERQHLSGGNHFGSLDRRVSLRLLARPIGRLCHGNGHRDGRRVFYSEDHTTDTGPGA